MTIGGIVTVGSIGWWALTRRRSPQAPIGIPAVHPGITLSRIPITGVPGAMYMIQFLVWALWSPAVGLFYAALVAGGLLLVPLAYYLNRPGRGSAAGVGAGGVLGLLCGLGFVGLASSREVPLAALFSVAVVAGVLGAALLAWSRSRERHPSIAPYGD